MLLQCLGNAFLSIYLCFSLSLSPSPFLSHCLQLTWAQFSLTVLAARGKVIWTDPQCFKGLCQSRETPCVFVLLILMVFWGVGRFRTVLMCQWMKYCSLQSEEIAGMTLHMEAKQKHIQKQHQCVARYKSISLLPILSQVSDSCWNENNVYWDSSLSN